jgi:hypothetical protein
MAARFLKNARESASEFLRNRWRNFDGYSERIRRENQIPERGEWLHYSEHIG